MKIDNEREESYYKFDLDLTKEEFQFLRDFGAEKILEDEEELINYAVAYILKNHIDKKEKENGS